MDYAKKLLGKTVLGPSFILMNKSNEKQGKTDKETDKKRIPKLLIFTAIRKQ